MDTEWLKYFMTIAEGSTFFVAAEKHSISQSSLSKAIMRLESELNVELFDRNGRRIKLTPSGKCLYDGLKELVPGYSKMLVNINKYSKIITCWAMPSISVLRFHNIINEFLKTHPKITIDLVGTNDPFDLSKAMEEGKIDLAFIHQSFADLEHYNITFVCDDYLLAVLPVNHPLAGSESIHFADLRNENIILNKWKFEALSNYFSGLDFTPKITKTNFIRESVLADVASENGVALYYSTDISIYNFSDVVVCRIEDVPHNPIVIATPKKLKLTDSYNQLIQYLVNNLANNK